MATKRGRKNGARRRAGARKKVPFRSPVMDIWTHNAIEATRIESYSISARVVEELLKDPKLRRKLEYLNAQIFKAIAAAIPDEPPPD